MHARLRLRGHQGKQHTLRGAWEQALAPRVAPLAPRRCHRLQALPHSPPGSALAELLHGTAQLPTGLALSQPQQLRLLLFLVLQVVRLYDRPLQVVLRDQWANPPGSSPAGGLRMMLGCPAALRAVQASQPAPPHLLQGLQLCCHWPPEQLQA